MIVAVGVLALFCVQRVEAQSFDVGETRLSPSVRIDYISIDNLFNDATDEVSATGVALKPKISWIADRRLLALEAYYSGEYAFFSEDEADYDDHTLGLSSIANLSSRQRVSARLELLREHENQGDGQTSNVGERLAEQITKTTLSARADYQYGAKAARGNLTGGVLLRDVQYSNLEQFTDGDDFLSIRPYGEFALRVSQDTRLLAETRFESLDYDDDRRDRNEISLLTGIRFAGTGKLIGSARIGVLKAQYENVRSADSTKLIAEVGMNYTPLSHSQISLNFNRGLETVDASEVGAGQSVVDNGILAWTHEWSGRVKSIASLRMTSIDRECPSTDDLTLGGGLELNVQLRRWLSLGISASQATRDQKSCSGSAVVEELNDYDRSVIGLHVSATL